MFAATSIGSAATKRAGTFSRLFSACLDSIERYIAGRAAIEWLRELDDRALRDIGLARSQIEAAVHGFMAASELGEDMMITSSTAVPAAVGPPQEDVRQLRSRSHGVNGRHGPGRFCRRVPDLLHEGRVRRRVLHRRHSVAVVRDGPGDGRRSSGAIVHRNGSLCPALLEALDVVEAGPCAAVARARARHRARLSAVPRHGPSCRRDRDGGDHLDLCCAMARRRL